MQAFADLKCAGTVYEGISLRATGRNFASNCPMAVETSRIMPCIGHCRAAVRSAGRSVNLPMPNPTSWWRMIARRRTKASATQWNGTSWEPATRESSRGDAMGGRACGAGRGAAQGRGAFGKNLRRVVCHCCYTGLQLCVFVLQRCGCYGVFVLQRCVGLMRNTQCAVRNAHKQ